MLPDDNGYVLAKKRAIQERSNWIIDGTPFFINKNKFIPHTVYPDYSFSSFLLLPIIFPKPLVEENRLIKNKLKYNKIKIMQKLTHQYWKEKLNR